MKLEKLTLEKSYESEARSKNYADRGTSYQRTNSARQDGFKKNTSFTRNQDHRYITPFNGYCYHARRETGPANNMIRCWGCNHIGHIERI